VRQQFESVFPDRPFEYHFLEDSFNKDLKSDKIFMIIFGGFSVLAILISATGIMGLLLIIINQNIKELAIRKALGAKPGHLMMIISRPVIGPLIVALIIAIPLSNYGMKNWLLNNYPTQIGINYELFLYPVIFIALVIVSIIIALSLRVKKMRIAEVLQYE
jgi:putative ABC transport system permease protein